MILKTFVSQEDGQVKNVQIWGKKWKLGGKVEIGISRIAGEIPPAEFRPPQRVSPAVRIPRRDTAG